MPLTNTNQSQFSNIPDIFNLHLDNVGDGSGIHNIIGDYSGAPVEFFRQPISNVMYINRMIVSIRDSGGFQAQEYGNRGSALLNGIKLEVKGDKRTTIDLLDGKFIKINADYAHHYFDAELRSWGAGDDVLVARCSFSKYGFPIKLNSSTNDKIIATFNDDFSALVEHHFMINGYWG